MIFFKFILPLVVMSTVAPAALMDIVEVPSKIGKRCTGITTSYASVAAAVACTAIVIGKFKCDYVDTYWAGADYASEAFTMTQGGKHFNIWRHMRFQRTYSR